MRKLTAADRSRTAKAIRAVVTAAHAKRVLALFLLIGVWCEPAGAQRPRSYPPLSSVIAFSNPQVSIGSADQEGPALFGEITDVALDSALNVYVLDRTIHGVRVFSRTGRFLGSAGASGRGPGDLAWPYTIFHDGGSRLYIVDRLNGVNVFDTRSEKPAYLRRFAEDYLPTDACLLGDHIVIPGWHNQRILHLFSLDGDHVTSFGEGFNSDTSAAVREFANQAQLRIACDHSSNRIFVTAVSTGIVRAYEANGRLIWQRRLPDFLGNTYTLTTQGVTTFYGRYFTSSILRIGAEVLLVQARHREPVEGSRMVSSGRRSAWEDRAIVSYALSAQTGDLLTRDEKAPLIGSIMSGTALGYEQDPVPRAFLVRWSDRRR